MTPRANAVARDQRARWIQPDAARWVRPDAARFLRPGTDAADVFPALLHKYSEDQPRVPAGNGSESGRWASESSSGRPRVRIWKPNPGEGEGASDGSGDFDWSGFGAEFGEWLDRTISETIKEIGNLALFGVKPTTSRAGGVQLAGDWPGLGHNGGPPLGDPPEVPKTRPYRGKASKFLRIAAGWLIRATIERASTAEYWAALSSATWIGHRIAEIQTYQDPPRTLQELHDAVHITRPGTEVHHIAEQEAMRQAGFSEIEINVIQNKVRIPILKHYQITEWYGQPNNEFGGLSPREYLSDKSLSERMRVGYDALRLFGMLKP